MSVITKGRTFSNGEQLTAEKLNVLVDDASFDSSTAVDNSTTRVSASGAITVRPQGITSTELASSAVTTAKIADATSTTDGVTFAKIRQLESMKTIGNVTGSTAAPTQVDILDEDDMSSDSATSLATQQSIKAYAEAAASAAINTTTLGFAQTWSTVTGTSGASNQNSGSRPIFIVVPLGDNDTVEVSNDGSSWITLYGPSSDRGPCSIIVPPSSYYRITGLTEWHVLS
tara:strand:- start:1717 stop:2403 length:687 start_codon:yes stop_codon:yes gene_type:complete